MKILILLKKIPGGVGGGVKNIKKVLESEGHEVKVISREEDMKIFSFVKSIMPIRKLVKKIGKNYDVIYTQDWSLALPLLLPYRLFRKKHFCMFHGNQLGLKAGIQNFVGMMMGKKLLCMAPSLGRRFPRANLNYCGVSLEQFESLNKKRKYLGWIAKGTELLNEKEVLEISKKVDMPLLIAKGFKHEEMNDKFYSNCKAFISFPPEVAGFQASWLEAMAAGVPIVIGNVNGAGEIQPFDKIPRGQEHNFELIAQKIKYPIRIDYKKWIKQNDFTWKRHARKLIEIFRRK